MSDTSSQKQQRETSPTTRITSLSTLRALQKAAKQLNSMKDVSKDQSPVEISRNKSSTPEKRIRDKASPGSSKSGKFNKNPEETSNYELRKTFQTALSKLYTIETKNLALNELKTIIMNNLSPKNLRIFLSSLTEYKKVDNPNTQEIEVFLLGFISSQFKEDLIDPLDKVPSLLKTCFRIIETIQTYFKVPAQNVATACGYSLQQVYVNSLRRESVENKSLALYEPLAVIISGGTYRVSQTTASLCLCDLLLAAIETKDNEFLEDIRQKYVTLFLKVNYEIADIIKALGILMGSTDIRMSGSKLNKILEKLIKYAQTTSPVYQIKLEVCSALSIIGTKLLGVAESFIGNLHEEVIGVLRVLAKDRLIKVQNAANEALKVWNNLKKEVQNLEAKKMTRDVVEDDIDELIKLRTGIDVNEEGDIGQAIQNMDVLPNDNPDDDGEPNQYILDKLRKGLKKKSGTGGGFVFLEKDKRPQSAVYATENKKKQSIKEMIQKSAVGGSNKKDKFDIEVKFPGQEYVQAAEKRGRSLKFSVELPSEMSFHPLNAKESAAARNLATPPMKNESKNSEYWHGSHESKKERQMELTNQLAALQSQGYIQNVPHGQLVSSYEGPFIDNASESPSFPGSHHGNEKFRSQQGFASQMMKETTKSVLEDSLNMRQYEGSHGMSQTVESMNFTSKAGRSTRDQQGFPKFDEGTEQSRRMTENPSTRSQKEFVIRHNKSTSFKQKGGSAVQSSNLQETIQKGFKNLNEDYDLEETMAYDNLPEAQEKSLVKPPKTGRELSNIWDEVLKDLEKKDIEKAYERVADAGDDIYLMRLMSKTGPCLEQLNRKTATDVTNRIVKLSSANFMEGIFMNVIKDGFDLGLADSLNVEDQNNLLEELYSITANDTSHGRDANYLYSTLVAKVQK